MPSPASEDLEAARRMPGRAGTPNPAAVPVWLPPAVAADGAAEGRRRPAGRQPGGRHRRRARRRGAAATPAWPAAGGGRPRGERAAGGEPRRNPASPRFARQRAIRRNRRPPARKPKPADARAGGPAAPANDPPERLSSGVDETDEELAYRVDFLGITMGYARFRYNGKVSIAGKTAYHLNVRAWTSGVLSFVYPINETIDYYLDAETLAPIRQEFTQRGEGRRTTWPSTTRRPGGSRTGTGSRGRSGSRSTRSLPSTTR